MTTSKTLFIRKGNQYDTTDSSSFEITDRLPAETFRVGFGPLRGFYLEATKPLEEPSRIYGDIRRFADRVVNTFVVRGKNTGVLLVGAKGTGKSMTLRCLSAKCIEKGMPTIIVDGKYVGPEFASFLNSIVQPCAVTFDEFEKTYSEEDQNQLLSLLDGMQASNKLFVFTANNKYKLSEFIKNRPGRVFYNREFRRIDIESVREYCQENMLDYDAKIADVEHVAATVDVFNFDMLQALVEEMNRYNESARAAIKYMNIRAERGSSISYSQQVTEDGKAVGSYYENGNHRHNPLTVKTVVCVRRPDNEPDIEIPADGTTLVSSDALTGVYVFKKDKYTLTITRSEDEEPSLF